MAVKFFVRFNLHNSLCSDPPSVETLRSHLNMSDGDIGAMLCEIDEMQNARAERLIKKYPKQAEALRGKKVVFLGDSITNDNLGYRESVTRAGSLEAFDGSVSGGTSSTVVHTAKMLIEQHKPDIVSVMLGSNDSVMIEEPDLCQVSPEEYGRNVARIVRWAKQSGAEVLLFEIPPVVEERFEKSFSSQSKAQTNANVHSYNEILKKIADENGIKLRSNAWLSEDDGLIEPDGIHLSISGQERFAEQWLLYAAETI